jgi:hypothetical protein
VSILLPPHPSLYSIHLHLLSGEKRMKIFVKYTSIPCLLLSLLFAQLWFMRLLSGSTKVTGRCSTSINEHLSNVSEGGRRNLCVTNSFSASLFDTESIIRSRLDALLKAQEWQKQLITLDPKTDWNHERFRVFNQVSSCNETIVGGLRGQDTSKIVCGIDNLRPPCVVYSIGGNNQWEFELDILKKTECTVHTFDCTGPKSRFKIPTSADRSRLFFHHECLGSSPHESFFLIEELAEKHGHSKIDLLKMDIEGYEFSVFDSLFSPFSLKKNLEVLPMQILVEVHYRTQFADLLGNGSEDNWKREINLFDLNSKLLEAGYIVASRDDNSACNHCSELTLLRFFCDGHEEGITTREAF